MDRLRLLSPAYREVLVRHALASDELGREQALLDAGELAKQALAEGPALDQMVALHQATQAELAADWRNACADTPLHTARERLASGEATQVLLALMLPHELAQRAHHESRWQREHDTLGAMFKQTDQLIVVLDADGLIEDVNPAFVRATGWSPLEAAMSSGQVWRLVLSDCDDGTGVHRCVQQRRDGSSFIAAWSVSPILGHQGRRIGHVCIGRDVTRAQQVEAGLRENDKLRAVATLAGGIAHDFNNLLGSIMGLAELCALEAPPGTRLARNLGNIGLASQKAAALVRQLLDFSRRTPARLQPVRAGDWLQAALPLLRATVQGRASLSLHIEEDSTVRLDPVQMEQVLLNLVRNAADAIGAGGGSVQMVVDLADLPDSGAEAGAPGSGLRGLRLRVIDSGHGIDPAVLDKIFDPFFTTKPVGQGTGLGLAAVHGIVVGHGGQVTVDSKPGEGCTFSIYLPPLHDAPPAAQVACRTADDEGGGVCVHAAAPTPKRSTQGDSHENDSGRR